MISGAARIEERAPAAGRRSRRILLAGLAGWLVAAGSIGDGALAASPIAPRGDPAVRPGGAGTRTGGRPGRAGAATGTRGQAGALRLLVEPDDGMSAIDSLLASAKRSVELVMYELDDPEVESILAADARRGVAVRVLLDGGYERRRNTPAFDRLAAGGVAVRWSSSRFWITHEKSAVVDSRVAAVMTLNLTSYWYPTTRDFAVLDSEPADVAAIARTFSLDWTSSPLPAPAGADLVWSPGSTAALVSLIGSARQLVEVENEEMGDPEILAALSADARRHVRVEVTMTADPRWDGAFSQLHSAGVVVHLAPDTSASLYVHAKAIVVDPESARRRAFVGSENFSVSSLVYNRELGLVTSDRGVVRRLASVLSSDFAAAPAWR